VIGWALTEERPTKMAFFQTKLIMKDPQVRRLSNQAVATKHLARTECPRCKHGVNCFTKIIRQGPSGPGFINQIRSSLLKRPFQTVRKWRTLFQQGRIDMFDESGSRGRFLIPASFFMTKSSDELRKWKLGKEFDEKK
jgi:hypothetical protein